MKFIVEVNFPLEPFNTYVREGTAGQKIGEVAGVFPRIDAKVAIPQMRALEEEEAARQAALLGKTLAPPAPVAEGSPKITIDDFAKVDLRVARVLTANR